MPGKPKARDRRVRPSAVYFETPWRCEHPSREHSEIRLLVNGKWEPVATVWPVPGLGARELAEFIAHVVNGSQSTEALLTEARALIEEFMEYGLNFSSEIEGEKLLEAMNKRAA